MDAISPKYFKLKRQTIGVLVATNVLLLRLSTLSVAGAGAVAVSSDISTTGSINLTLPIYGAYIALLASAIREVIERIISSSDIDNPLPINIASVNVAQTPQTVSSADIQDVGKT